MSAPSPVLLIAPQGFTVTGVNTWMLHLARGLSARGRRVGLLIHGGLGGHAGLPLDDLGPVTLFRHDDLASPDELAGRIGPLIQAYRDAAQQLAEDTGQPAVVIPTRHGDCFGACCALTMVLPESVRLLAWQHIDGPYEDAVINWVERGAAGLAAISTRVADSLKRRLPHRAGEVVLVRNGTPAPDVPPKRDPIAGKTPRSVKLLYTGRLEHEQKRVSALVACSDHLRRAEIPHELTLLGDGPAAAELDRMAKDRPHIRRLTAVAPKEVNQHLDAADIIIMASRREGLSLTLIEGMARGCVPVIALTASGAAEVVEDGQSGVLVQPDIGDDDETVGRLLADGVLRALDLGLERLAAGAHRRVKAHFSLDRFLDDAAWAIDRAAAGAPRRWPASRACSFSAASGSGGGTPPDAPDRMTRALAALAGRTVAIHGTGGHTLALGRSLASSPAHIVALTDDDPARHGGSMWGWPIVSPDRVAETGATDVVLSSAMHEPEMWARRAVFESQGLAVHRLYPG